MTKVQPAKPLIRETDALYKKRPIILEVHSGYLAFRVTWHPIRYALSIEGAFFAAAKAEAIGEIRQLRKLPKQRATKEVQ